MTFSAYETSQQAATPIELFHFNIAGVDYYYTSTTEDTRNTDDLVYGAALNTYLPTVIKRTQHRVDNDEPGSEIELEFHTNDATVADMVQLWITAGASMSRGQLQIYKTHRDDPDQELYALWFGYISSVRYKDAGTKTVILCRSLTDLFTLEGPRKTWGTQCNHQLFDEECTLSRVSYTVTATVDSVATDGVTYTLTSLAEPSVRYNAGEFRKEGTAISRLIVARSGSVVTLQYPAPDIVAGDTVELVEGCQRDLTDCASYSNTLNFGGTPYTPDINPFTKGLDNI